MEPNPIIAAPVIKSLGGKRKQVPSILAAFGHEPPRRYIEPLLGGGAVLFAVLAACPDLLATHGGFTINDAAPQLMRFYQCLRNHPAVLIQELATLPSGADWKDHYAELRSEYNALQLMKRIMPMDCTVREAALFLWLNKAGFRGLFRLNSKGGYNVPPGDYPYVMLPSEDQLMATARALLAGYLRCEDFAETLSEAGPGDWVYCDPPYLPLSKTAHFTDYTVKGFGLPDHARLLAGIQAAAKRGARVILSGQASDELLATCVRAGASVKTTSQDRAINRFSSERRTAELLATWNCAHA